MNNKNLSNDDLKIGSALRKSIKVKDSRVIRYEDQCERVNIQIKCQTSWSGRDRT